MPVGLTLCRPGLPIGLGRRVILEPEGANRMQCSHMTIEHMTIESTPAIPGRRLSR